MVFAIAEKSRITPAPHKMKNMPTARVFVIIASISALLIILKLAKELSTSRKDISSKRQSSSIDTVDLNLFEQEITSKKDISSKRQSSPIDTVDLKLFEQEIRSKFTSFLPNLSALEQSQHNICIRNLEKNHKEDKVRYFKNQAKSEKMRHDHLSYLKPDSVVLEIGGNKGHDTNRLIELYDPVIITVEPVEEFAKRLEELFKDNKKVTVLNFGLGRVADEVFVKVTGSGGDATSMFSNVPGNISLIIANTTQFLLRIGIRKFDFDLLLINCEGCEYEVLEAIISSGLTRKFKNIQIAAHMLPRLRTPDSRYCQIEVLLNRTHSPTYRFRFIWEHWRRNDMLQDTDI